MDVSIIIVNYHTAELVKKCIESIFNNVAGINSYEIIIVDNSYEKELRDIVDNFQCNKINIRIVIPEKNLGFGKANNIAAKYARGKYLFLLNPDTVLLNDGVSILYRYLEEHSSVGIAGGNLYTPDGKPNGSYSRSFSSLNEEKNKSKLIKIILEKVDQKLHVKESWKKFNETNRPLEVAYIYGADMMLKRSLFEEVNGFDPDFFMYGEESELTYRINKLGYKVMSIPNAKIIHLEGAATQSDISAFNEKQFRMRMNGTMMFFLKCYGKSSVDKFHEYRSKRYKNLIRIAKIQRKLTDNFIPLLQLKCLNDEYEKFLESDIYGRDI